MLRRSLRSKTYQLATMKVFHALLALTLSWSLTLPCKGHSLEQSQELLESVLETYDRRFRPTLNQSRQTLVDVSLILFNIEEFDEVGAKLSITGALFMTWFDEKIRWNATDYGGVQSLKLPPTDVWYPPLILMNPHSKYDDFVDEWMSVRIWYTGRAVFAPGAIYKSTCSVDVTYYPFDVQICTLGFIPFGYDWWEVTLSSPWAFVDGSFYTEHAQWDISENASFTLDTFTNAVFFTFKLQRKPMFFVVNIIIPIVLMSYLNILIFVLPPQSGERISYGITVLLAIAVFLTIVGDNLPKTSNPLSILSYFLIINLATSAVMCLFAIMNMRIYFRDDEEPLTYWAFCIIRVANCDCRSQRRKKIVSKSTQRNGTEMSCNVGKGLSTHKQVEQDMDLDYGNKNFKWSDVSKVIDRMCIIFFILVISINTTTFITIATQGPG